MSDIWLVATVYCAYDQDDEAEDWWHDIAFHCSSLIHTTAVLLHLQMHRL